ncbi:MAG: SirB2 family protein [Halioglobus sp.]
MTLFGALKLLHMGCALLSIAGFTLRGYWMLTGSSLLRRRAARIAPHVIDTLLLGSAIGMLMLWRVTPLQSDWLSAKIIALLIYIGLGMVALRFGKTRKVRVNALLLALLTAGYIVSVAYSKSPWGFLQLIFV